ncbi:hypothetical protein ACFL0X_01245 [Nanoarchaeota archaeon]
MIKEFVIGFGKGTKLFGETIATVINCILLTIVYILGIGLTSIFAKIVGKRFLDLKKNEKVNTYWIDLDTNKKTINEYYRQF